MTRRPKSADSLFLRAEQMAHDFSLFPSRADPAAHIEGLLREDEIKTRVFELQLLDVDSYIEQSVLPSENKSRVDARKVLRRLKGQTLQQGDHGPLYWAEMILECDGRERRIGFIAQNRSENNGVWMPEHHQLAVKAIRGFTQRALPIVTFIDTPGADAGAEANLGNQAHSISHLIAEMAQIDVPCVGIILGSGYSGGAIPLATVNILLSVRDSVFNTIQPPGLASIARKYDLSWQECAKYVGVSAYELYEQDCIDGIIDYVPGERHKLVNLRKAIFSSIDHVERTAMEFVSKSPFIFDHYRRSMQRYLKPKTELKKMQDASPLSMAESPTTQLNVFGIAYRYLRYLGLRSRTRSISKDSYGRLSELKILRGDLQKRADVERQKAFEEWLAQPLELRYDEGLLKAWRTYKLRKRALDEPEKRIRRLVFGSTQEQFDQAHDRLCVEFSLHLFNRWKTEAHGNLLALIDYLTKQPDVDPIMDDAGMTVKDVMLQKDIRHPFIEECQDLLIFDLAYDHVIQNLQSVAREANEYNVISESSVRALLDVALHGAAQALIDSGRFPDEDPMEVERRLRTQFETWIGRFKNYPQQDEALKAIETWKKKVFPRIAETLFAFVTFFFGELLPRYYGALHEGKSYDGRIQPRNIGIKDFWNRLSIAYRDLLIQDLLTREKRGRMIKPKTIIDRFFTDFRELNSHLMTSDPVDFPGFRLSIEAALSKDVTPCGLITGIGRFKTDGQGPLMGVAISNLEFQAGAFDMASTHKFCDLLRECMERQLPVVCFISSGGMQTKEGAGALYSMPILNDRLTRFIRDQNFPVICFGFGDCTGGAQASFVTHPLVQTYYLTGTNMPFAGQIVVPSYLPSTSTLSNYLSEIDGSMQGLVKHPFWPDLDQQLENIDPRIPLPKSSVEEVVTRILEGRFVSEDREVEDDVVADDLDDTTLHPIRKVLIHARGCAAAKLIRKAQEHDINVVLVQSDADADSAVAELLGEDDTLINIGGNTPDESYLNATSIIRIAEQEKVDAVHPGIGFLSENSQFAELCRSHGIRFVGPTVSSMEMMGNKSNAINTARRLGVTVVPGSEGIVTTVQAAKRVASHIGYPVLIKAVHGGGGKGIQIVNDAEAFPDLFRQIRAEAQSAFGNSDVYLERCVTSMRHVEVQLLRDTRGNTKILGLRDCTVQRNNQKIVEESASTMLPPALAEDIYRYTTAIANDIAYTGAGTVEFIYDIEASAVYFMEMNTRLQVEHPVTEAVTGVDIVKGQFDIAAGDSIEDIDFSESGHAIEVRLNAETLVKDENGEITIKPCPGMVTDCYFPTSDHTHVLKCIGPGKVIPPFYDSMVAQIICKGTDRSDAIVKLLNFLEAVQIRGVSTNLPLLKSILRDETFVQGFYDTKYLGGLLQRLELDEESQPVQSPAEALSLSIESLKIEGTNEMKVVSPSTGVFYLTPSPNEPELVKEGDVITVDTSLCLLEAMKLFTTLSLSSFNQNENALYTDDSKYRVVRVVPSTGQVVNVNDLLFVIEPLA